MLDHSANPVSLHRPPRAAELVKIGLLLAAVLLAQVLVTRSFVLFRHTLWLDEILTWVLVNDPSFTHAMSALHGGVDTNPPTMYLILWPIAKAVGGLHESGLHIFSFASVVLALLGLFSLCRMHFDPLPSFIGVMAVAAHPLVVHHAFEARFYGPWLAAIAWYALAIARLRDTPSKMQAFIACILAAIAATVHYFGIIAVLLISAVDLLLARSPNRHPLRRAIPPMVALAATCACIPFVLGQRQDLRVQTWIDPTTFSPLMTLLTSLFGATSILLVVFATWVLRLGHSPSGSKPTDSANLHSFLPINGLLLFPFVIIAFSMFVQPSVLDRYMIVAVAPLSGLAAYLVSDKPKWFLKTMVLGLFAIGAAEVGSNASAIRGADRDLSEVIDAVHSLKDSQTVVFKRRVELFPLLRAAPEIAARASLLDFDPILDGRMRPFSVFERDMGRKFEMFYPYFRTVRSQDLSRRNPVFVILSPNSAERYELKILFPDRTIEPHGPWMGEILPQ